MQVGVIDRDGTRRNVRNRLHASTTQTNGAFWSPRVFCLGISARAQNVFCFYRHSDSFSLVILILQHVLPDTYAEE